MVPYHHTIQHNMTIDNCYDSYLTIGTNVVSGMVPVHYIKYRIVLVPSVRAKAVVPCHSFGRFLAPCFAFRLSFSHILYDTGPTKL